MPKGLIVLIVDHDTFNEEVHDGKPLDVETLTELGRGVNEDAANILGYEGWIVVPESSDDLLKSIDNESVKIGD